MLPRVSRADNLIPPPGTGVITRTHKRESCVRTANFATRKARSLPTAFCLLLYCPDAWLSFDSGFPHMLGRAGFAYRPVL